jgi:flagellar basal-body rod protein FlgB
LLASNVANLDTPGYQTKDLSVADFRSALKEKIAAGSQVSSTSGDRPSVEGTSKEQAEKKIHDAFENILYHDGSNVSLEQQVTQISKNQSTHSTAITILRHQLRQLQMAIGETVNV